MKVFGQVLPGEWRLFHRDACSGEPQLHSWGSEVRAVERMHQMAADGYDAWLVSPAGERVRPDAKQVAALRRRRSAAETLNQYSMAFTSVCPADGELIEYRLALTSKRMVLAEELATACNALDRSFHEEIADRLHEAFGGHQLICATHQGVGITTTRGDASLAAAALALMTAEAALMQLPTQAARQPAPQTGQPVTVLATQEIERMQRHAAELEFEAFDFGDGRPIADCAGWESDSETTSWRRVIFLEADAGESASTKAHFTVTFQVGTATVIDAFATLATGEMWGQRGGGKGAGE